MTGFLPQYGQASAQQNRTRMDPRRNPSVDPRLPPAMQQAMGINEQAATGQDVDPIAKFQAGQAMSQEAQMQQAQFQGALKQAASGQGGQPQEQMPQGQAPSAAGWQKYVKGNVKYLNQFLPQY